MHRRRHRRQARVEPGAPPRWELFTHGGRKPTGLEAIAYAREVVALGAGEILLTSMDRDGTKAGFDLELTRAIADAVTVPVIASGGVGTLEHLVEGVTQGHASAVLAASIFHYGTFTIGEAKRHMAAAGLADAARRLGGLTVAARREKTTQWRPARPASRGFSGQRMDATTPFIVVISSDPLNGFCRIAATLSFDTGGAA